MKTGIYPLNKDIIPKEKMLPAEVFNEIAEDCEINVSSTEESSPRKAMRTAVLNQLRTQQATQPQEKKTRKECTKNTW